MWNRTFAPLQHATSPEIIAPALVILRGKIMNICLFMLALNHFRTKMKWKYKKVRGWCHYVVGGTGLSFVWVGTGVPQCCFIVVGERQQSSCLSFYVLCVLKVLHDRSPGSVTPEGSQLFVMEKEEDFLSQMSVELSPFFERGPHV